MIVIAEGLRHFPPSTAMNVVDSEVLINLGSVGRNYLKLRQSGVHEALHLVDNTGTLSSYLI